MTDAKERSASKSKKISKRESKSDLLDDEQAEQSLELTINPKFARDYDERKRRQEMGRARELGLVDRHGNPVLHDAYESEDSITEDEGFALTPGLERQIAKTIEAIRKKDARVYDPNVKFFEEPATSGEEDNTEEKKEKKKKKKAKDVIREQLLEAAATGKMDAFEDDEDDFHARKRQQDDGDRSASARVYDDEQAALRKAFISKVDNTDSESDDDFLKVRSRTKGDEDSTPDSTEDLKKYLRTKDGKLATSAEEIPDPDSFLQAFVTSRSWKNFEKEKDDIDIPFANSKYGKALDDVEKIIEEDEQDEEAVEKADKFESEYNFRFEDPLGGQIVSHARNPTDTMRRQDSKRKEERQRREERKAAERLEAENEARRLMNLKRAELKSRMTKIREIGGKDLDMNTLASVLGDALEADFDPDKHDEIMAKLYGEDYYGRQEEELAHLALKDKDNKSSKKDKKDKKKKEKKDEEDSSSDSDSEEEDTIDEAIPAWVYGDGDRPSWAGPSAEELARGVDDIAGTAGDDDAAIEPLDDDLEGYEDGMFDGDEDGEEEYDPAVSGLRRTRGRDNKRKRAASKKMTAVARAKAIVAAQAKAIREGKYQMYHPDDPEEVSKYGFEDIIAGGLKTRFKYVQVPSEDFGLSTEDILLADDQDLNSYVGLRRLAPYRENPWVVPSKTKKKIVSEIRKKNRKFLSEKGFDKANVVGAKAAAELQDAKEQDKKKKKKSEDEKEEKKEKKSKMEVDEDKEEPKENSKDDSSDEEDKSAPSGSSKKSRRKQKKRPSDDDKDSSKNSSKSKEDGEDSSSRKRKRKRGDRKEGDKDKEVVLESGKKIKKSRLDAYAF